MKQYIFILIIFLTSLNIAGQSAFQWANVCGHPYYSETKSLLDVDQDGNVIMAGNFIDTAIFGADHVISAGFTDIFMAKYDPSGELLWLTGDGGEDYEYLHGIASDEEGFFTCGTFYGTSNIGGNTFASFGSQDIFIARYDHDGNFIWARHIGSPKTDYANAVDADSYGNIVITGHYYDSIAFPDTTVYAMSASDIFLASFDADGNMIWVVTLGGSSSDQSHSISCDNSGNILVTGSFFNDITIADTMLSTTDPTGVFMAKFNNSGDLLFAQQLDGNGLIARSYASFDSEGNFFHAGNFTDQLSLGPYYFNAGPFNIDVYISKYNAMGDLLWADHGHSPGSDQLVAIHSGPLNDLYLTGHYLDTIFFGDIELKYTLCCGSSEIFIVRYTEDGTAIWGRQVSGVTALVEDMCKNNDDELFLAGMFKGELLMGDISIYSDADFSNYLTGVATGTMTAIRTHDRSNSLKLFPNPASDRLNIFLPDPDSKYSYQLIHTSGKILQEGSITGVPVINISDLPAGVYIFKLSGNPEAVTLEKLVIQ